MTSPSLEPERVREACRPEEGGVVALVDRLLGLARDEPLSIAFEGGRCLVRARSWGDGVETEVALPKPVFRAVLARLHALCEGDEHASTLPYRGRGRIVLKEEPVATVRVSYLNTPSRQRVDMEAVEESPPPRRFTVLLQDGRVVTVVGSEVRLVRDASSAADTGSYGVVSGSGGDERLIALFPVRHVVGVFSGDLVEPRPTE